MRTEVQNALAPLESGLHNAARATALVRDYFEAGFDYRRQAQTNAALREYIFSEDEMELILFALNNAEHLAEAAFTEWEKRWDALSEANGGD